MPLTNEIRGRLNRIFGPEPGPELGPPDTGPGSMAAQERAYQMRYAPVPSWAQPRRPVYGGTPIGREAGEFGQALSEAPLGQTLRNVPRAIRGEPLQPIEAPPERPSPWALAAGFISPPPRTTEEMANPLEAAFFATPAGPPVAEALSVARAGLRGAGAAARVYAAPTLGEMVKQEAGGVGRKVPKAEAQLFNANGGRIGSPLEVSASQLESGYFAQMLKNLLNEPHLKVVDGVVIPKIGIVRPVRTPKGNVKAWQLPGGRDLTTPQLIDEIAKLHAPVKPPKSEEDILKAAMNRMGPRKPKPSPKVAAPAAQAKQPWEMTEGEFASSVKQTISGKDSYIVLPDGKRWLVPGTRSKNKGLEQTRKAVVAQALSEGKLDPNSALGKKVLADYPDLVAQAKPVVAPETIKKARLPRITPEQQIGATRMVLKEKLAAQGFPEELSEQLLNRVYHLDQFPATVFERLPRQLGKSDVAQEEALRDLARIISEYEAEKRGATLGLDAFLSYGGLTDLGKREFLANAVEKAKRFHATVKTGLPTYAEARSRFLAAPGPRPAAPPAEAVAKPPKGFKPPTTEAEAEAQANKLDDMISELQEKLDDMENPDTKAGERLQQRIDDLENYKADVEVFEEPAEAVAPRAAEVVPPKVAPQPGELKGYKVGKGAYDTAWVRRLANGKWQVTPSYKQANYPNNMGRGIFGTEEEALTYARTPTKKGVPPQVTPQPVEPLAPPPPAAQAGAGGPPARPGQPMTKLEFVNERARQYTDVTPYEERNVLPVRDKAIAEYEDLVRRNAVPPAGSRLPLAEGAPPARPAPAEPVPPGAGGGVPPAGRGTPPVVAASAGSSGNDGAAGILRAATNPPDTPGNPLSSQNIMQDWQGRLNVGAAEARREWKSGQDLLRVKGIGQGGSQGHRIVSQAEGEGLLKALHGEGPVPKGQEAVFAEAKRLLAEIQEADLAAAPELTGKFMAHPDYMPRLWIPPPSPRVKPGGKPFFLKPRVDATFSELLEAGYQPASWNLFDMIALRRLSSVEWRAQREFMPLLQRDGYVKLASEAPKGWRVPDAPGFRSRPTIMPTGEPAFTPALATPNYVADIMESMYGYRPTLRVGDVDVMGAWTKVTNWAKSTKLIGSLFQHVDMSIRAEASAFRAEGLLRGAPIKTPALTVRLFMASLLPGQRGVMLNKMLSGKALYKDFPISLKDVADHGWEIGGDTSVFGRTVKSAMEEVLTEGAPKNIASKALQRVKRVNRWWQDGLFEGVYREAQSFALENAIIPAIRRSHPDWTVEQVARAAAEAVNVQFSTLAPWQTVFRQPAMKAVVRNLVFSPNESEAWLRAAFQSFTGQNKWAYADNFIGLGIFMAGLANVINLVSEGKLLPADAYTPIRVGDPYAFLPGGVSYNNRFLSPMLPFKGRNDEPLYLDVVGQADTVFRWLMNPPEALASRENVPIRAAATQIGGETFFGKPLTSLEERGKQFAQDIAMPIGAGSGAEALRQAVPQTQRFIPEGESRLGVTGSLVQTSGLNIRGMPTPELLDSMARDSGMVQTDGKPVTSWWELSGKQKNEIIAQKPELKAELEARDITAAETMQPGPLRKAYVREAVKAQEERDEWLEKGKDKWGRPYGPEQWRAERESAQVASAAVREIFDQLRNQKYPEPRNDNQKALKGYYEEMEKFQYKDSFNTEGWMEARDKYLAKLSDAQAKFVMDSLHPNATATERKYLKAQETLRPYWELKDTIEEAVIAKYPDFANVLDSIKWYEAHAAEGQNRQKATALRARQPYKVYKATLEKYQNDLRAKDKNVEGALLQWGYVTVPIQEKLRENRPSLLRR